MINIAFGILLILHGLVHLLYIGQSRRMFELQQGMVWPDGSWAFSHSLGNDGARQLASAALVLAAAGFVAGGISMLAGGEWWRPVVGASALLSTLIYLFFWDGELSNLDDKGAVGMLINLAILAALLFQWLR